MAKKGRTGRRLPVKVAENVARKSTRGVGWQKKGGLAGGYGAVAENGARKSTRGGGWQKKGPLLTDY